MFESFADIQQQCAGLLALQRFAWGKLTDAHGNIIVGLSPIRLTGNFPRSWEGKDLKATRSRLRRAGIPFRPRAETQARRFPPDRATCRNPAWRARTPTARLRRRRATSIAQTPHARGACAMAHRGGRDAASAR